MLFHFQYSEARSVGHHKYVSCLICSIARHANVNEAGVSFFFTGTDSQITVSAGFRLVFFVVNSATLDQECLHVLWTPDLQKLGLRCQFVSDVSRTWGFATTNHTTMMVVCEVTCSDLMILMNWWKWFRHLYFRMKQILLRVAKSEIALF